MGDSVLGSQLRGERCSRVCSVCWDEPCCLLGHLWLSQKGVKKFLAVAFVPANCLPFPIFTMNMSSDQVVQASFTMFYNKSLQLALTR